MATEKVCDVCGAIGAYNLVVSITSDCSASGMPVGTSQGKDLCDLHRAAELDALFAQCKTDIEAAIIAP